MIINSVSYLLSNWTGPENPKKDSIKKLYAIDGTQTIVNYGSRISKTASMTIINMTQANYLSLTEYLITNAGKKIAIRPESAEEIRDTFISNLKLIRRVKVDL